MTSIGAMIVREIPPAELAHHAGDVQHGFDELWIVEDLPYAGGISQMVAVLDATENVVVGHGLAPAPFRNPVALAMEWATLAELYPGRIACALGHGVQTWMAQMGEGVESPLTLLRESTDAVRRLLAGESVTVKGRYVQLDDLALRFPPAQIPRVSLGVVGPRSLRLSGSIADGTVLPGGYGPRKVAEALDLIRQGASEASATHDHRLTLFAEFHCGRLSDLREPDPDAPQGWEAVGDHPDAVAEQLQSLINAGADALILVPMGPNPTEHLQLAAAEIVPQLVRNTGPL